MTGFEDEYRVYDFGRDEFVLLKREDAEKLGLREVPEEEQKDISFLYADEFISFFTNPPSECEGTGSFLRWDYPDMMESFRYKVIRAIRSLHNFRPCARPIWAEMRAKYFDGRPYVFPEEMIEYLNEFDSREIIGFLFYCAVYKERFHHGMYGYFTKTGCIGILLMRLKIIST